MITAEKWKAPELPADIPGGDMPGDKIQIEQNHIDRQAIRNYRMSKYPLDSKPTIPPNNPTNYP